MTDFGLEVAFDGSDAVTVVVPSSYSDNMCGLCGNYNGGTEDDWTVGPRCPALEGTIVSWHRERGRDGRDRKRDSEGG